MSSANIAIAPSQSSVLSRNKNLETYSLIWLDSSVNSSDNRDAQQQLRSAINHIRVFENGTECEIYIRQSNDNQILLIVSGQLGSIIVPLIHSLRQLSSIYVYCLNSSKHKKWTSKFIKIRAVITNLNELIEKITSDGKIREKSFDEPLPISIFNSISNAERSSTNINGGLLHFQLLIDGLLHLRCSDTSRKEFFALCKTEYEGNQVQLSIIREFEQSYIPERAIYWYTRHSFLYRMLNKALRVQDIRVLFLFRFFIQDLYHQLKKLQREQEPTSVRVYRGQLMSKQELNDLKESKGRFIAMNSFLSTSLYRQKSVSFASSEHDDLYRVLFEIDVSPHLSDVTKPFANISSQSQFENEQEVLFMIATLFHVVDIRQENEIIVIHMELSNQNYDHDMKVLFEYMHKENEEYHECLSLGHILRSAGMYDQAEQFYKQMLNESTNDDLLTADLWGSIGLVRKAKGEMETSTHWLNKSLKKYEQIRDLLGIARSLQNLADIHQMNREFNQATNKYNQALKIFEELFGAENKSIAHCLNNLGANCFEQGRFTEALQYYGSALDIRKKVLPCTHPDIAITLHNIGTVYLDKDEYDLALQYFEQALDIYKISLPSEHSSIARTYHNVGLVYFKKIEYERSLVFLNRAACIRHNTLSPHHPDVYLSANTIDYVKHAQFKSK